MMNQKLRPRECSNAGEHGQSGQALVELALSMSLFFVLLLGATEFGRLAYEAIEISDAAKAAAQYGSQNSYSAYDTSGILLTAQKSAPYVYANCTNFTATSENPMVCMCMTGGSTPPAPTAAACTASCAGYVVKVLQIQTSATCTSAIHPRGFSSAGITLHGSAVQEVLN
jgi:Flp pilus assembly protein TadG